MFASVNVMESEISCVRSSNARVATRSRDVRERALEYTAKESFALARRAHHSTPRRVIRSGERARGRAIANPPSQSFEWMTTAAGANESGGASASASAEPRARASPNGSSTPEGARATNRNKRAINEIDDDERARGERGALAWGRGAGRSRDRDDETPVGSASVDVKSATKSDCSGPTDVVLGHGAVESKTDAKALAMEKSASAKLHRDAVEAKRAADTLRDSKKKRGLDVDWIVIELYMTAAMGFVEATGALGAANAAATEAKRMRYAENAKFCEFVAGLCDHVAHKSENSNQKKLQLQAAGCSAVVMRLATACRRRVLCMSEAALSEAVRNADADKLAAGVNETMALLKTERDTAAKINKLKTFCRGDGEFEGGEELYNYIMKAAMDGGAALSSSELVASIREAVENLGNMSLE